MLDFPVSPQICYYIIVLFQADISEDFANFFESKVKIIVDGTRIKPGFHNGHQRIFAECDMFMSKLKIVEREKSFKI